MNNEQEQLISEAKELLDKIQKFSSESSAKLDVILQKIRVAEEQNHTNQTRLDAEINSIADGMDAATIDFVKKISE